MKKVKMKLEDLKVQSFVTSMEEKQKQTINGGLIWEIISHILTDPSPIGSGGACSEGCPVEPVVPNPWCTEGGAAGCGPMYC